MKNGLKINLNNQEKDLLLKDLCARLPYGVMCDVGDNKPYTLSRIEIDDKNGHLLDFKEKKDGLDMQVYLSECRPYLLPLSSMTEEQKNQLKEIWSADMDKAIDYSISGEDELCDLCQLSAAKKITNWLIANHFDYRGFIGKSLALDATNLRIYE